MSQKSDVKHGDHYMKISEIVDHVAEQAFKQVMARLDSIPDEIKNLKKKVSELSLENMALEEDLRLGKHNKYR